MLDTNKLSKFLENNLWGVIVAVVIIAGNYYTNNLRIDRIEENIGVVNSKVENLMMKTNTIDLKQSVLEARLVNTLNNIESDLEEMKDNAKSQREEIMEFYKTKKDNARLSN